jgi:transcriptional regulator
LSKWKGSSLSEHGRIELPQGTLDILILKAVSLEPLHGWAISERLQQISKDVVQVQQGSLYPALHRLERRGWLRAKWATTSNNRRAKFYEITAAGRKQLSAEARTWRKLAGAVASVLDIGEA